MLTSQNIMLNDLRNKYPTWINQINKEEYNLVLSDDIDSLFSCKMLQTLFQCEIRGYVDWNSGSKQSMYINKNVEKKDNFIGIDMALEKGKIFDNHVTKIHDDDCYNFESANINVINNICRSNYYSKFCGSTLIQIMSLYNLDISKFNDEQKFIICCIDGLYIPYKIQKIDFSKTQRSYMKLLEYEELSDFMKYHCDKNGYNEFYKIIDKYNLDGKIKVDPEGRLVTDIDVDRLGELFNMDMNLDTGLYKEMKRLDKYNVNLNYNRVNKDMLNEDGIFNFVLTNKNYCIYSML